MKTVISQYLEKYQFFSMKILGYAQNDMGFALEVMIFLYLLTARDRTIFPDNTVITIKITDNKILSHFLIKLPRFYNLSVGDIFTDKPKNQEKLLIQPKIKC